MTTQRLPAFPSSLGVETTPISVASLNRDPLNDDVERLVRSSLSDNTQRAYLSDLRHFHSWGGALPAEPNLIASYLAAHRTSHSVATLERRLASIAKAHAGLETPNPARTELVRATLRGIKRTVDRKPRQATPLVIEALRPLVLGLGSSLIDLRDAALLLIGFAGGFRRSELVSFDREDVEHVGRGIVLTLRRSKTDQSGNGRKIAIPLGRTRLCPVTTLQAWLDAGRIESGPIFRPVDRAGRIYPSRLSAESVTLILKRRLKQAGCDPSGFSGHSLRAGFATSAAEAGAPIYKIRAQTGHASDAMLQRYIRDADLFRGNAASMLL